MNLAAPLAHPRGGGLHMITEPFNLPFAERTAQLGTLAERLRRSHFAIDTEIHRLIDAFAPWHQFAEARSRPRAIGLWGMTGTGKSSLLRELVKATGWEQRTIWQDGGNFHTRNWLEDVLQEHTERIDGKPFILVLDEFQHAFTMGPRFFKEEPPALRMFWELLDSGRVIISGPGYTGDVLEVHDYAELLASALRAGVRIERGRVIAGKAQFQKVMDRHSTQLDEKKSVVPHETLQTLRNLHWPPQPSIAFLQTQATQLDGPGILQWITAIVERAQRPRVVDCSKMLVVMLGNLDEFYLTGKTPLTELDPDVLLHLHRTAGLENIQHALTKLFRIEQVGRMGNTHIAFPPIGQATVDKLVAHAVTGLEQRLKPCCGCTVEVDATIVDHLRATSSIAVLGARPVVQAVENTVPLMLSRALARPEAASATGIQLRIADRRLVARFIHTCGAMEAEIPWHFSATSTGLDASLLERISVHESGHLVCGMLLGRKRPLQACARSKDPESGGFVIWERKPRQYLLRKEIVPELAVIIGGWAAERLHYGAYGVSNGSSSDIRKAGTLALDMAKNEGMGAARINYALHSRYDDNAFHTDSGEAEAQARQWIEEAEASALATLREHRELLDECTERLIAKGSLHMEELNELFNRTMESRYIGKLITTEA